MQRHLIIQRRTTLIIYSLLSLLLVFTGNTLFAVAEKTLPPGVVIGDEAGVHATSEGEYFVDLPNVLPGEKYEKTITIRSMDVKEPFELGMIAVPKASKGIIDFDKQITLTLVVDGKTIYQGPLLGDGKTDWTVQPLKIGICEYGKDQILTATFEVNSELSAQDYTEESQLLYHWKFVGTKNQPKLPNTKSDASSSNTKPKELFPMTGEEIKQWIYKLLTGLLLVLIAVLLWKKRKEQQKNIE
ncbi:LPXTG cell wall anchor domain-containing protein [Enterococcus sp. UD-01]|jgi:LPXTG-motif cell wall-anchored protein|uniref:LPXTG cell wall anchor domain-containing protein n=1 Tax=Enterococcus sp. UD-01 TaxID=3373911 RepID=UPI0038384645